MTNSFLLIMLICHVLGDYYLQPSRLAQFKKVRFRGVLLHCAIYALPFIVALFALSNPLQDTGALLIVGAIILLHAIVDSAKWCCFHFWKLDKKYEAPAFVLDQTMHIVAIVGLATSIGNALSSKLLDSVQHWQLLLFFLALGKPTNVAFKKLFSRFALDTDDENGAESKHATESGAGAIIGTIERYTMGIFACLGQFAAMGLVMAAKTLSRYNRISNNPRFAEYYLIGTLFSVLSVALLYLLIFGLPPLI